MLDICFVPSHWSWGLRTFRKADSRDPRRTNFEVRPYGYFRHHFKNSDIHIFLSNENLLRPCWSK